MSTTSTVAEITAQWTTDHDHMVEELSTHAPDGERFFYPVRVQVFEDGVWKAYGHGHTVELIACLMASAAIGDTPTRAMDVRNTRLVWLR